MIKKLKSLFVVEKKVDTTNIITTDDSNNPPPVVPTTLHWDLATDIDDKANLPPSTNNNTAPISITVAGTANDEHLNWILAALEKHNLPGFDYLEFRHLLRLSESSNVDEKTRYDSALAYAKIMGCDAIKLENDAMHYIKILEQQSQEFEQNILVKITTEVGDIEKKIQELLAENAAKEAQITTLQGEILQNQQIIDALKMQISQTVGQIEQQKNDFTASNESVQMQILQDIQKLQLYK